MDNTFWLKRKDHGYLSLVQLPTVPEIGSTVPISPAEVIDGRQPDGQQDTTHVPARTIIQITSDLGEQRYHGQMHRTFEYEPGTI